MREIPQKLAAVLDCELAVLDLCDRMEPILGNPSLAEEFPDEYGTLMLNVSHLQGLLTTLIERSRPHPEFGAGIERLKGVRNDSEST